MLPGQGDTVIGHLIGAEKLRAQYRLVLESGLGKLTDSAKAGRAGKHLLYAYPYAIHKLLSLTRINTIVRSFRGAPTRCAGAEQRFGGRGFSALSVETRRVVCLFDGAHSQRFLGAHNQRMHEARWVTGHSSIDLRVNTLLKFNRV